MLLKNSDIVPRSSFSDLPITWGYPQQSIKFNIFSLYGHIGPALTPEPSDQEALNFKTKNGIFIGVITNLSYMFPLLWKKRKIFYKINIFSDIYNSDHPFPCLGLKPLTYEP